MLQAVLTIAGSDPCGGAGLQADLKTFHQFGLYGMAAVTLITVQDSTRVHAVECLAPELVRRQIEAVLADWRPAAVKVGALGTSGCVAEVAEALGTWDGPLVIDPISASSSGQPLLTGDGLPTLQAALLPGAWVVTPNLQEASALCGWTVDSPETMERAARRLCADGPRAVLVTGGHLADAATDVLCIDGRIHLLTAERLPVTAHGTGCALSAAIAAGLALGRSIEDAVTTARGFVRRALAHPPTATSAGRLLNPFVAPPSHAAGK